MASKTVDTELDAINCRNFYGRQKDYIPVVPPDDPHVSDVGSSSSDEEDVSIDNNSPEVVQPRLPVPDIHWESDDEILLTNVVDDTWDSEDEVPLANLFRKKKKDIYRYTWTKTDFAHQKIPVFKEFLPPTAVSTPFEYFQKYFDQSMFQDISDQTNLYSVVTTGVSLNTTPNEIRTFIGIEILMGIINMPSIDDYWAVQTRYPLIADVMPVKRFKKLRRLIHFQDNNTDTNGDPLYKMRPVMEKFRQNCLRTESELLFSIDEMMIAYKGTKAGSLRQYMPKKPKKWGFKMFVRSGVSGIVYDFLLYTGAKTFDNIDFTETENSFGLGAKVVLALCKNLENPQESIVYCDNFFTSLDLVVFLKRVYGIHSLGTIRSNRLKGCILENDKTLLKKGRGSYDYRVDNKNGVAVVKWADSKCVTLASSCVSHNPIFLVKRYVKEEKKRVDIECPQIIRQYNNHMGGVDLADMLIALYKLPFKSRRWYLGIFAQLVDIAINNSWLLYRRDMDSSGHPKHINLKTFRTNLAITLIKGTISKRAKSNSLDNQPQKKIRVPVAPRPPSDIRFDQIGHFPSFVEKGRCKLCTSGQTSVFCGKCNLRLCIVTGSRPRNCFTTYHMKP